MAKGYDKGLLKRRGDDFFSDPQADLARKLGEIVSDLYLSTDESDIKRLWSSAHRLLLKSPADPARIETVMKQRRIGALSTLAQELLAPTRKGPVAGFAPASTAAAPKVVSAIESMPAPTADQAEVAVSAAAASEVSRSPSPEQLKSAMKAFRKRLKLTKLDDESKLGHRATSGGRQSKVVAIMPPREYPMHVWEELARQGKLRNAGSGFFELVGE